MKSQLTGKAPDAGKKIEGKRRATENEMVGWHHQLNGHESEQTPADTRHESEQTPGDSEGQGSLVCCSSQHRKEWDAT